MSEGGRRRAAYHKRARGSKYDRTGRQSSGRGKDCERKKRKNREEPGASEYIWQEDEARVSPDVRCTDGHRNQARYLGIVGAGDGGDWERNVGVEGEENAEGQRVR